VRLDPAVPPLLWEVDMQGIEKEDAEEAFRRGYEHAAIETFHAIEQFLDPSTREVLRTWIEKDVYVWRLNAMLGYPPTWRLKMLARPSRAFSP
jgi:hypothetical protein